MQSHNAQDIIAASDSLECREWCINAPFPKQELMHFDIDILHPWDETSKYHIRRILDAKPALELVTFHMASCCDSPILENGMYQPGGKSDSGEELLTNAHTNISWLRSFLPESIQIGVENNNYYPTPAYDHVTDGDFIVHIVEENAICFLFDIAHGKITAHNMSMDYKSYLETLPLNKTIQLHISQHEINPENIAMDAHAIPGDAIYEEVKSLITTFPVQYLTLECYRDPEAVLHELMKYHLLAKEINCV